jgi:hypothetical protein
MSGTSLSEQAAALAIDAACCSLRLPTVRSRRTALPMPPPGTGSPTGYTSRKCSGPRWTSGTGDGRSAGSPDRRIAEARFPRIKRLDDFDLAAAPAIPTGDARCTDHPRLGLRGRGWSSSLATPGPARVTS